MIVRQLFNPNFKKRMSIDKVKTFLDENNRRIHKIYTEDPDDFYHRNFDHIIDDIKNLKGLKLRVSTNGFSEVMRLSRCLPIFCDHVVFSPAPSWPSCYHLDFAKKRFSEFNTYGWFGAASREDYPLSSYLVNRDSDQLSYYGGLYALRPLIETGLVTYLPQRGRSLHRWDYPPLDLPNLPNYYTDTSQQRILKAAMVGLFLDSIVSIRLGCYHYLPSLIKNKVAFSDLTSKTITKTSLPAYILLSLKIPYVENIDYYDLASFKQDEYQSFSAVQQAIIAALNQIQDGIQKDIDLDSLAARIQSEVIDEPLLKLEAKLNRVTKYKSLQMAGLMLATTAMILTATCGPGILSLPSEVLGSINIIKVYETYIKYLEEKDILRDDSAFYLLKIKKKGKKWLR